MYACGCGCGWFIFCYCCFDAVRVRIQVLERNVNLCVRPTEVMHGMTLHSSNNGGASTEFYCSQLSESGDIYVTPFNISGNHSYCTLPEQLSERCRKLA